jgi:uncharacterized protein DUF4352
MPARAAVAVLGAIAVLATACTADPTPASQPSTRPTYRLDPGQARPDEKVLSGTAKKDGDTSFALLGLTTGQDKQVGSHIEFPAKNGQFIRVRVEVTNTGRSTVPFDAYHQLLVLTDGNAVAPDDPTMQTKRQPHLIDLGAGVRVEFDLYYDVARDAKPKALRAFGGATLYDAHDEESTDIAIR